MLVFAKSINQVARWLSILENKAFISKVRLSVNILRADMSGIVSDHHRKRSFLKV